MQLTARINAELRGDKAIWAILAVLGLFSLLAVYSSTGTLAYRMRGGNTESFLIRQLVFLSGGVVVTYLIHMLHYRKFSNWAPWLLMATIPLLLWTLAFGTEINEARRWITVPVIGITFQSSDFAKLALIIYVARTIGAKQDYIKDFQSAFLPIIVPILIVCGLIAPADLSSAMLLFVTCMVMMFVGRVAIQYILLLIFLGVVVFAMLFMLGQFFPDIVRTDTWVSRFDEFMHPEMNDITQMMQSKIAIANGGWFGLGPGNSIQRNYLYSPHADFVYAIIVEEYGIMGGLAVILLYVMLFFRVVRLVTKSPKAFGAMLAMGISIYLIFQAFINIAVALNIVPVTGLTLPMISMGGTSLLFTCVAFGILLSISKFIETVGE